LIEDTRMSATKRWVVVAPNGSTGTRLLLAKAANPEQEARVGDQTGGRVFLFLDTDDFQRDHAKYVARGVNFIELPRHEPYGTVAVFKDLYGNKWDFVQRRRGSRRFGRNGAPLSQADGNSPGAWLIYLAPAAPVEVVQVENGLSIFTPDFSKSVLSRVATIRL
jgi:hypothetical protein